jgi:putative ABC transport system permease protein
MQMKYVLSDRLGFKKDHIITVEKIWQLRDYVQTANHERSDNRQAFVDEISKIPGVEMITRCSDLPGNDESGGGATWVALDNNQSRTDRMMQVDEQYANLLGLQIKQGRFFSPSFATDSFAVVINEKAAADFGLKNPVGARLVCKEPGLDSGNNKQPYYYTIIGVVKDYHFQSLRKDIAPLILINATRFGWGSAGVKIKGDQFKTTLAAIQKTWAAFDAKHDFKFSFLDTNLAAQYKAEEVELKIFTTFSLMAIAIACIGLFGLATYTTLQRSKEIGVRKVLGATTQQIVFILSKDFMRLVIIAAIIAFPVAWWAMHAWLQNFAYRVTIAWWVFILAGIIAAGIAIITISFQSVKAALSNPVKSLRTE